MTAAFHILFMYLQEPESVEAPNVKVLSCVAPDRAVPAWSRLVSISESNTVQENPGEAFSGWDRGMSFSDTSQFLVVSGASRRAMMADTKKNKALVNLALTMLLMIMFHV